jgi:hypothetical protein
MERNFRPKIEAKILTSPVTGCRYVVTRYARESGIYYSDEYFRMGPNDQLSHEPAQAAIRSFLGLPKCDVKHINPYYEPIWDEALDVKALNKLRAELTAD